MSDPLVLSASSITTFLRCGQQWYYAYMEGIKSPPSIRRAIGVAAHRSLEVDLAQKIDSGTDLPVDDLLDAFRDTYEVETYGWEPDNDDETPEKGEKSGLQLVRHAHEAVLPPIQPVLVEEPVQFRVGGIPYSGIIDLADSKGRVMDWKTTKRRPTNTAGLQVLQMTGYAVGYRQLTGERESEVVLQHLVRTQVPQHIPVASGGPVTKHAINVFAQTVATVHQQIQAGRFLPNGLVSGACSWCGYKAICPAYREFMS